jgi:hypothetical protein
MIKFLIPILILFMGPPSLFSTPLNILEEFQKRIGYPATNVESNVESMETEDIIFGIPDMTSCPILQGDWKILDDSILSDSINKVVSKHFYYSGSLGKVFIDFVYSFNSEPIEYRLFDYVATTSKYPIPGERGPIDIGDFSIQFGGGVNSELRFIRKNIFVGLTREDSTVSIFEISRWIQSQFHMQPRREVQEKSPRPSRETIGKQSIREGEALLSAKAAPLRGKVGEPIEINVEMPAGAVKSNYLIQEHFDNERFRSTKINGLLSIIPTKPGQGAFSYMIIDKNTLLFSIYEFVINVQP